MILSWKKKKKFIYILTRIIAVFFPTIPGTLKTPVPFIANF